MFGVLFWFVTLDKGSVFICVLVAARLSSPPLWYYFWSVSSEMDEGEGMSSRGIKRNPGDTGSGFPGLSQNLAWANLRLDKTVLVPPPVMGTLSKLNRLESEAALTVGGPASSSVALPPSPGLGDEGRPRVLEMEPASQCFQAEDSLYQMKSQAETQHVRQIRSALISLKWEFKDHSLSSSLRHLHRHLALCEATLTPGYLN